MTKYPPNSPNGQVEIHQQLQDQFEVKPLGAPITLTTNQPTLTSWSKHYIEKMLSIGSKLRREKEGTYKSGKGNRDRRSQNIKHHFVY